MIDLHGIIVPIITPFDDEENFNEAEMRVQINRQLDAGIHGIFCLGTNGEFYAITEAERERIIDVCVETTAGRRPVFAGTGCAGTLETIRLSKCAKALGADALSVVCPYFALASQDGIYRHYAEIASAVDMPLVLYNIPARTGNAIAPSTLQRLTAIPNIVAIKDSSGNFDNMLQYIECCRGTQVRVISGTDSLILWNLMAGGTGGIAGCANVFPYTLVSIYEAFVKGDIESARAAQDSLRPLRNVFRLGNPNTVVKAAVSMLNYPVGQCRAPFNGLSTQASDELKAVLTACVAEGMC